MDSRESLKNMLNNLINDKTEEAQSDLHAYLTTKMRDMVGTPSVPDTAAVEAAPADDLDSTE